MYVGSPCGYEVCTVLTAFINTHCCVGRWSVPVEWSDWGTTADCFVDAPSFILAMQYVFPLRCTI